MAVNLSPIWGAGAQLLDNSGNVLSGGKIYTYAAGTTTQVTTFTDGSGVTAHSNPIVLNSAGRVPYEIWLTDGQNYKFVLKDSNDVLIGTWDNLSGINSNFIAYTNQQEIQTATAGQTVFNLTTMNYLPGTNSLSVFVDGVNQYGPGAQYAYEETDSNTVTFASGLHVGAEVKFTSSQIQNAGVADATQISYTYPATNAVTETLEERLAQYVSVKDFGAVGDGVTDDTVAIQNALDYATTIFATVTVPPGSYYVTSGITIPAGTTLTGLSQGDGWNGTAFVGGSEIVAELSVPVIVTLNGGAASVSTNMNNMMIRRVAGTIPAGSIGVKILSTDQAILQDVVVRRSAVGISVQGQLGISLIACNTTECTQSHLEITNSYEVTMIDCRFGRNGGGDLACNQYVKIYGQADTISFLRCQFNQSGNVITNQAIYFQSYSSPNGIVTFQQCHAEAFSGPWIYQDGVGTGSLDRLSIANCTINSSSANQAILQVLSGFLSQLNIVGNPVITGTITVDQQLFWKISDNFMNGNIEINKGSGTCTGNVLYGQLTVIGNFPDGIGSGVVVANNTLAGSSVFTNTATGNVAVFGNVTNSASVNSTLVNNMNGAYLKMQDVPFAVKTFTGTLSGSGTATLSLSQSQIYILNVQAFYKGNSGEAVPMTVSYGDGTGVVISGGTASRKYRASVLYSATPDLNW